MENTHKTLHPPVLKEKLLNRDGNSYLCYLGTPCKQIFKQFYFQGTLWRREFSFRM